MVSGASDNNNDDQRRGSQQYPRTVNMGKRNKVITQTSIRARQLLAEALITLATTSSFWYNVTGDSRLLCSLMVRLGFESAFEWYSFLSAADLAEYTRSKYGVLQLNIKYQEWTDFLKEGGQYGLCEELFTFRKYRLDLASFADGKKQDGPRDEFYAL